MLRDMVYGVGVGVLALCLMGCPKKAPPVSKAPKKAPAEAGGRAKKETCRGKETGRGHSGGTYGPAVTQVCPSS